MQLIVDKYFFLLERPYLRRGGIRTERFLDEATLTAFKYVLSLFCSPADAVSTCSEDFDGEYPLFLRDLSGDYAFFLRPFSEAGRYTLKVLPSPFLL